MTFKQFFVLIGILFLLFIGWLLWQLFGPAPTIVVSKATTFITSPLRPDGLPDYEKHLLEKMREGVTPANNAAVLFWQAMGPGDMEAADFDILSKEIGLKSLPTEDEVLQSVYGTENRERITEWLRQQKILPPANVEEDFERFGDKPWTEADDLADRVIDQALGNAWTSDQIPPLVEWVKANEKPLDLLVAASKRPRFYSPPPSLLNEESESLVVMLLYGIQTARDAARALTARAMWHLGEGQPAEAWADILAIYRFSRLMDDGESLLEQFVSIAIEGMANQATLTLLDDPKIPAEVLRKVKADLAALEPRRSVANSFDQLERLCALDALLSLRNGSPDGLGIRLDPTQAALLSGAVNWNIPLRILNDYYDGFNEAAKVNPWSDRRVAMDEQEQRLNEMQQSLQWQRAASGILSSNLRSELVGDILACRMLPSISAALAAEDRANTQLTLIQLAAAIAIYRTEHGEYPEKLDSLVPDVLDKLPVDLFHDNSFVYRRTKTGYLLYSLGPNDKDDGGNNQLMNYYQGYSVNLEPAETLLKLLGDDLPEEFDPSNEEDNLDNYIPQGADDTSIRVPLPKLELPKREEPKQ